MMPEFILYHNPLHGIGARECYQEARACFEQLTSKEVAKLKVGDSVYVDKEEIGESDGFFRVTITNIKSQGTGKLYDYKSQVLNGAFSQSVPVFKVKSERHLDDLVAKFPGMTSAPFAR